MGKNYSLNINITPENYRVNLTTHQKANPKNAFNFCMAMRKRLIGGTIEKIYMKGLERIIYIDINCYNELNYSEPKTLIIELMGRHCNIILVDENNIIIDSLRHLSTFDNSFRNIMPGFNYIEIENNKSNFMDSTFESFYQKTSQHSGSLSTAISKEYIGISKFGIKFSLDILAIDDSTKVSLDQYNKLYEYIKNLIYSSSFSPVLIDNNYYINLINSDSDLNFFIDDFYYNKELSQYISNTKKNLLSLILRKTQKLKVKLSKINNTLSECSKIEDYKLYGELIISNLYRLNNYSSDNIILENYYNNNDPICIKLDSSISPTLNAERYFKKYKKLQNALVITEKQKELVQNEIDYLDSIVYEITNTNVLDELIEISNEINTYLETSSDNSNHYKYNNLKSNNKKLAQLPSEYLIDGFAVYVGKNNKQNDYLTCKIARNNDLWFHTKDIHGSHVVLKLPKNLTNMPDSTIYKCATIAAFFSKAKLSQNVPVDYTFIKYVKKPNGSKPGMVIYTNNKTLYVNPKNPTEY